MIKPKAGIIIIILVAMLFVFAQGYHLSTYRPGWELSSQLVALECNNAPEGKVRYSVEASNIQCDFDNATWGLPDIKATISDVREEYPKMPYKTLEQDFSDFKYVIDYHEYLFDIQVRTIANVQGYTVLTENVWIHETAAPHNWKHITGGGGIAIGKDFDGGVYARFSCLPYGVLDYGPIPENYQFNGYWLGIMNAKVEAFAWGDVATNLPETYAGWVRNVESVGSQVNMFYDDGEYAQAFAEIPWDADKILDPDIKNTVIVYLPFNMLAGAYENYNPSSLLFYGNIDDIKPIDVWLTYTIRMETLVVKEFEYRDPATPPNPSPIESPEDYVTANLPGGINWWLVAIIVIIILLLLIFLGVFVGIPIISIIFRGVLLCKQSFGGEKDT